MAISAESQNLRRTGINSVGDVPWGTHFCYYYETSQDLLEILVPYFEAGLKNNEFCLWVIAAPIARTQATEALQRAVPDLEQHLAKGSMEIQLIGDQAAEGLRQAIPDWERHVNQGSIEIIPHAQWYLKDGIFDLVRVINDLRAKLDQALA